MAIAADIDKRGGEPVSGDFLDHDGERYYVLRDVDRMAPFFISVVSNDDHWLFVSSTGGLTAGRVSPETALFPYQPVDRIHDSYLHTGSRTLLRFPADDARRGWEPFNLEQRGDGVTRNLYKNVLGNKLCFEEINGDLGLAFRYTWETSPEYGFVRRAELENLGTKTVRAELLDGLQNLLPAGTPEHSQANASNLVDAYKWSELDARTGLASFSLYSGISDRAEPSESLRATTAFCLGLADATVLLSSRQIDTFRRDLPLQQEDRTRGVRGAYLVNKLVELAPGQRLAWRIVADVERSQAEVVALGKALADPAAVGEAVTRSVDRGSEELARIMAGADGFQVTAEEHVAAHHYANVLFNVLRGGTFVDQYTVPVSDFVRTIRHFNRGVHDRNRHFLKQLPATLSFPDLFQRIERQGDPQLVRLAREYLPITFGRRHGDPSRPWNRFAIRLKDETGERLLSYQGNWRDIFQNWEALALSYPEFIENVIAKFVNASTVDGYNPYRITKQGIDWEVEDPDDPWSYIGYWGDHQIVYLLKLLELSAHFHPSLLNRMLRQAIFCYANVPYRIRPFKALLENPKSTVVYDSAEAERIAGRLERIGADGKLVLDADGDVYRVNLLEKLLVPLLAKLGNLVVGGGIWLNTQRPEWNDANNALVGHGLSMVTLCYMRRYVEFLGELLAPEQGTIEISAEVCDWLDETSAALASMQPLSESGEPDAADRYRWLCALGEAASRYRDVVYGRDAAGEKTTLTVDAIRTLLRDALGVIDHSIAAGRREDGLFDAYNLMSVESGRLRVDRLYPMLEGQVAALSSGAIDAEEACSVLDALFESDMYRPDQDSFMLYPDRKLPGFLEKNRVPAADVDAIPLLTRMLAKGDQRILVQDDDGLFRFNADFRNSGDLQASLQRLRDTWGDEVDAAREPLLALYEQVFDHRSFTGRSGGMFGFEGLGCIYWHMVSKLLLAVQEQFFAVPAGTAVRARLGDYYYRVRAGLGFNKSPQEYGAFPSDPYSHTPGQAGAQQPGMTGQVKEEVISRFGELGVRVAEGRVRFDPGLLRQREFTAGSGTLRYLDVDGDWLELAVPAGGLAYTWCQVPIVYELGNGPALTVTLDTGETLHHTARELSAVESSALFLRSGRIRGLHIAIGDGELLDR